MGTTVAVAIWIATSLGLAAIAWLWQRRSAWIWGLLAAAVYLLIEDPSFGPLRGGDRFLPIDDPRLGTLSSVALTAAVLIAAMVVVPRGEPPRRRQRSPRGPQGPLAAEHTKQCPTCVETIRASEQVCPFCGHRFEIDAKRDAPV